MKAKTFSKIYLIHGTRLTSVTVSFANILLTWRMLICRSRKAVPLRWYTSCSAVSLRSQISPLSHVYVRPSLIYLSTNGPSFKRRSAVPPKCPRVASSSASRAKWSPVLAGSSEQKFIHLRLTYERSAEAYSRLHKYLGVRAHVRDTYVYVVCLSVQ